MADYLLPPKKTRSLVSSPATEEVMEEEMKPQQYGAPPAWNGRQRTEGVLIGSMDGVQVAVEPEPSRWMVSLPPKEEELFSRTLEYGTFNRSPLLTMGRCSKLYSNSL
jgi:hypothetical protein